MPRLTRLVTLGVALGAVPAAIFANDLYAQVLVEQSVEVRFQLDLSVPSKALDAFIPTGFTLNVATQGAAKDANLRAIFVDRMTINGPDGRPIGRGSSRLAYLAAPVTSPDGENVQLVIAGLTDDPSDAPGPYGVYLHADTHAFERSTATFGNGSVTESQHWIFEAPTGERLEMHITFERGVGNRGRASDRKHYSAANPGTYRISRQEQVLEILRNVTTTPPDRVRAFSFRAGGGSYAKLFDGTERVLSWDNIPWIVHSVLVP